MAEKRSGFWSKGAVMLGAGTIFAYLFTMRLGRRWGATDEEVHKSLPGDDILPHPMLETTHAVTIDASAEKIWPWLVQMGHYRAGFYADPSWWDKYSDKYLKSLAPKKTKVAREADYGFREVPSEERIIPEFQDLKEGDTILDGVPGTAYFTVRLMEEGRALVLYSDTHLRFMVPESIRENPRYGIYGEFSWAFVLEEQGEENSRLILRTRASYGPRIYRDLTLPLILIGGEFLTARKMLRGIKRRAEGKSFDVNETRHTNRPKATVAFARQSHDARPHGK